jgi:ATP-dependent DNA helicase DinG
MALFTSYRDLSRVHRILADGPSGNGGGGGNGGGNADDGNPDHAGGGYDVLAQGGAGEVPRLLEAFRASPRALLLGTSSFWEGIDLPGDDLEILVLTRLPFGVPTDPRFQARAERLEEEGRNPFTDLYLPEAVLRFKQGFGRLIRRRSDRGIVAVLDPRLLNKGYGRRFAAALPLPVTEATDGPDLAARAAAWWETHSMQSTRGDAS